MKYFENNVFLQKKVIHVQVFATALSEKVQNFADMEFSGIHLDGYGARIRGLTIYIIDPHNIFMALTILLKT